jgi:DNA polymerase III subunit gamma/tau
MSFMADSRYLVLARKWRPQRFEDVVGQDHITRTLRNAISSGRIHHAFLFIGSRGIGKTTTARILAKALNCLSAEKPTVDPCGTCDNCTSIGAGNNMDVIEIDGASNNGVEDVREIRDNIRMVPSNGRYKVYIIDEVHQLSTAAFNALLKTLEEPPPHAIFILATTEAHKIPATIVSRCQRYDFRRVGTDALIDLLRKIVTQEGITASDEALHAIARASEGGVRDSEGILDELITYCDGEITFQDVFDVLGLVDWKVLHTLSEAILKKDVARLLLLVEEVTAAGKDLSQFVQEILRYFRNLLVCKTAESGDLLHLPEEELGELRRQATQFSITNLIRLVEEFATLTSGFDSQLAQRIALESLLIRAAKATVEVSVDTVLEKLLQLGTGGIAVPAAAASDAAPKESPPDPPSAGVDAPAPPAPARQARRTSLAADALREAWQDLSHHATGTCLNLGMWAGSAVPVALERDTLVLRFPAEQRQAHEFVERPENRQALESLLQQRYDNVQTFRSELDRAVVAEKAAPEAEVEAQAQDSGVTHAPGIGAEQLETALSDPGVAKLVDVFKGRIIEVRPGEGAAEG